MNMLQEADALFTAVHMELVTALARAQTPGAQA